MEQKIYLYLVLIGIALLCLFLVIFMLQRRKGVSLSSVKSMQFGKSLTYDILIRMPVVSNMLVKISKMLARAGLYSQKDQKKLAIKFLRKGFLCYLSLFVFACFFYRDIISILAITAYGYVINDIFITSFLKKEHRYMLDELSLYINLIAQNYSKYDSVKDAITFTEPSKRLVLQVREIKRILESENSNEAMNIYSQTAPFKILQTFAEQCLLVNDVGDQKLSNGQSNFISSLNAMSGEINLERRNQLKLDMTFKTLRFLTLVPLFVIGPTKILATKFLSAISVFLYGKVGYISTIGLLAISLICYILIEKATDSSNVNEKDVPNYIDNLYQKRNIKKYIQLFIPSNDSKRRKIRTLINQSMSRHNIETLYLQKIVYFFLAFLIAISFNVIGVLYGKDYIKHNAFQIGLASKEEYKDKTQQKIDETDNLFIAQRGMTEEELLAQIKNIKGLSDRQVNNELERMKTKKQMHENTNFSIFDLWGAIAIGLVAYYVPNILLNNRRKIIESDAQEDIMQMLTLLSMYMYSTIDTQEVLRRLSQSSRVYKQIFLEAANNYLYNKETAFAILNSKIKDIELIKISNRLEAASEGQSLAEAFQNLEEEKSDILKRREAISEEIIKEKRETLAPFSLFPLMGYIFLFIIVPLGLLAFSSFKSFNLDGLL